jgi:hypothetical protein
MILVIAGACRWLGKNAALRRSAARPVLGVSLAAVLIVQSATAISWWRHSYRSGIGFAAWTWTRSELLKAVNSAEPGPPIFTNVPDLIYMWTGKHAALIPRKIDPTSRLPNERYRAEIRSMQRALKSNRGVVAYFHAEERLWYLPSAEELERAAGLRPVLMAEHGAIYSAE